MKQIISGGDVDSELFNILTYSWFEHYEIQTRIEQHINEEYLNDKNYQYLQDKYASNKYLRDNPVILAQFSNFYSCEKQMIDVPKAIELIEDVIEQDPRYIYRYLDLLKKSNNDDDVVKMIRLLQDGAKKGDVEMSGRLGHAYHLGVGVPVDLEKSCALLRVAADSEISWAKKELLQALWRSGTNECLGELVHRSKIYAEDDNIVALVMLSRAYRYGKGVEKNLFTAKKYLLKASSLDSYWLNELKSLDIDIFKETKKK